jgi:hypothetical protein
MGGGEGGQGGGQGGGAKGLARVFDAALAGGGAKSINFQELAADLAGVCCILRGRRGTPWEGRGGRERVEDTGGGKAAVGMGRKENSVCGWVRSSAGGSAGEPLPSKHTFQPRPPLSPLQITFKYPFRIPPYFALIIRAIGVLEGIALKGNPQFAIVDEVSSSAALPLLRCQQAL